MKKEEKNIRDILYVKTRIFGVEEGTRTRERDRELERHTAFLPSDV